MCRLFDDDNFDMFIDNNSKDYGFDSSFIVLLNQLRNMLNNYIEKNSDIEIITDPKWIKIALHAKKLYVYGIKNMVQDNESSTYKVIKIMRKKVLMV